MAVRKGQYELCLELLKHGAQPSRKKRKKGVPSALMIAAFLGKSEIVDLLLENGADSQEVCSLTRRLALGDQE
ncbi:ankyrin repeat domain-containing protein [Bacillus safensis]|uniref:ankyrin repeat domain-containing protein n=1 Tax=Bacillus safensis TaxID=561879 RepID=UPI0036E069A0